MASRRIAIYKTAVDEPYCYVKRNVAMDWIARGLAVVAGDSAIRMVERKAVAASSEYILKGRQGPVYEACAINPHRKVFQGGLQRTENRPERLSRFSSAKVGHQ